MHFIDGPRLLLALRMLSRSSSSCLTSGKLLIHSMRCKNTAPGACCFSFEISSSCWNTSNRRLDTRAIEPSNSKPYGDPHRPSSHPGTASAAGNTRTSLQAPRLKAKETLFLVTLLLLLIIINTCIIKGPFNALRLEGARGARRPYSLSSRHVTLRP